MWERYAFKWCDQNPKVKTWSSEEIVIPYLYEVTKRHHRYFVDLFIEMVDGEKFLVEIKPDKETKPPAGKRKTKRYLNEAMTYVKNQNKWQAAENYCNDRGWKFVIWTEDTLQQLGIMPKSLKPLKKLKPINNRRGSTDR